MTVQVANYTGQAKSLYDQAREILGRDHTAEEFASASKMIEDARLMQQKGAMLTDIGRAAAEMVEEHEDKAAPAGPTQFTDWVDFMGAVASAYKGNKVDRRLVGWKDAATPEERKDLVENIGASGGFLVPTEFYSQLMSVDPESQIVRSRATKIRMRRRQVDIPVLNQAGTTAGIPHWFGGMQFYWTEEAGQKTETNASFKKVSLVAHKLTGYTEVSDELLDDSAISLGDFFNSSLGFAGGIAWLEDYAFLRGTGAGQPLGVINAGATITVPRSGTTTPIVYGDLINMMESFLPSARGVWVFNQSCFSNLMNMQDPSASYIWQPNLQAGVPGQLWGMPVIFTEKTPTVGTAGDALLADFRYYLIGDRQATTIESTNQYRWQYDLTSWRAVHRVDGQPWLSAPLTLQDGTLTVSPFVILGAKTT